MRFTSLQHAGSLALAAALCLAGCVRRNATTDTGASTAGGTDSSSMATAKPDSTATAGAAGTYTDANIVALLDEANAADSTAGAYALTKASNKDVKAFAHDMMKDHHELRAKGQALAQKKNITPMAPKDDPLPQAAKTEMDTLQATPAGAQFDHAYINQEVTAHTAVIALVKKLEQQAQDPDLKNLIESALPTLQKHLDNAMKLQTKLNSGAMS